MSQTYLLDLVRTGTVAGSDAVPQDYQDALRALTDQHTRYLQLDDACGAQLCALARVQLLAAASRRGPIIPY